MHRITTTVAAADQLLTTLARVKRELGLTDTTNDAHLRNLIAEASDACASHSDRVWGLQTYKESVPGYGDTTLLLTHAPIVGTPSEVLHDNTPVTDFEVADADAGALYRRAGWNWTTAWGYGAAPSPRGELPLFTITYQAGFVLPGWATAAASRTLPHDIERACVLAVCHWYKNKGKAVSVASKKVGDLAITYDGAGVESDSGLPAKALALLPPPRLA